jgi:type IV secretion system protein VirB5
MKLLRHLAAAAVTWLVFGGSAVAQIPVTDVASLTQQMQQVAAWSQQYQQMTQQYQQMTAQLNAIKGARGMGQLLNNVSVMRQELPTDFIGQFDKLRSMGAAGATPEAVAIYDSIRTFNCSSQFPKNQLARLSCEASAMVNPTNLSLINKSIASSKGRMGQLQGLMSAIDGAEDTKAAQDLSNRINMETAILHNEKMMMDMALAQQERQAKILDQQKKEAGTKRLTEPGFNPFARQ